MGLAGSRAHEVPLMPDFKLPLSGTVTQTINPWTVFITPIGSQIGMINVNLGNSSNPAVEEQVMSDVASYGKQLGRIEDVLVVLMTHFRPKRALTKAENKAILDLKRMIEDIADIKERHSAEAAPSS